MTTGRLEKYKSRYPGSTTITKHILPEGNEGHKIKKQTNGTYETTDGFNGNLKPQDKENYKQDHIEPDQWY